MGDRQPLHERCQLPIARRPNQKMPLVRHQRIGTNAQRRFAECFPQDLLKRLVIRRLFEQQHARHASIQDVEDHAAWGYSRCSWHQNKAQ
jgi:hypothetical protein